MSTTTRKPVLAKARRKVTMYQDENPLMGATEAALALGVKQSNLRELSGLPKPFQVLAMGSVWLTSDIVAYREQRIANPPKPGPKPKTAAVPTKAVAASG
jgi:predicted DNA-binding transcriptional regulator AlpA